MLAPQQTIMQASANLRSEGAAASLPTLIFLNFEHPTLKGWIDSYESSRFTAIDSHTAVITSEYSMECLKEWLEKCTPITEKTEF